MDKAERTFKKLAATGPQLFRAFERYAVLHSKALRRNAGAKELGLLNARIKRLTDRIQGRTIGDLDIQEQVETVERLAKKGKGLIGKA